MCAAGVAEHGVPDRAPGVDGCDGVRVELRRCGSQEADGESVQECVDVAAATTPPGRARQRPQARVPYRPHTQQGEQVCGENEIFPEISPAKLGNL